MSFITGGHVQYTRRIKTGEYEHKDVVVLLNWSAQEGEPNSEGFSSKVHDLARSECERIIAGRAAEVTVQSVGQSDPPKRGPGRPPKVQQAEQGSEHSQTPKTDIVQAAALPGAPANASLSDDLDALPAEPTPAPSQVAPKQDDLGEDVTSALPPEITDKAVVDEITHTNGRIKNATVIRQLIGEYAGGPPKTSRDIPQNKRAEFIAKLKELKP